MTLAAAATGGALCGVNVNDYATPQDALDNEESVCFPPGVYGPIVVHPHQKVIGAGPGSVDDPNAGGTVFLSSSSTPPVQGDGSASLPNLVLHGFAAVHQGAGSAGTAAIVLPNLRSSVLEQIAVLSEQGDGLRVLPASGQPTWLNQILGCTFVADQGHAFHYGGTDSVFQGVVASGGINKTGLGALDDQNGGNRYVGCQFYRAVAGAAGLEVHPGANTTKFTSISACYFDENVGYGLRVKDAQTRGGPTNVTISGCMFRGNPNGDLHLDGVGGVVMTANTFYFGIGLQRVLGQSLGPGVLFAKNLVKGTVQLPGVNVTDNAFI